MTTTDPIEIRRSTGAVRRTDVFGILGSAVAGLSLSAWLMTQLVIFQGALPFLLVAYLFFVIFYAIVTRFDESAMTARDRLVAVIVHSLAALLFAALVIVVVFTFVRGFDALLHPNFFTQDMSAAGPLDPLSAGGILHAIAGTLIMITMALAFSIPLGVATAVYLSEFPGRYARLVRTVVEAMTALPSIVAGLFIYATVILILGVPRSGFAASLAITVMMLPIIIRSSDVVLRLVPSGLKEASQALGSSRWRTVWHVTLPTARSGLTTAIILGTARGIGETSPVLLTAGLTTFFNVNPFSGAMISLPLATFTFVKSPEPNFIARGFGSAAVLMLLVLVLFIIARLIGGRGPGVLTARQVRRRAQQSRADGYRFRARELGLPEPGVRSGIAPGDRTTQASPADRGRLVKNVRIGVAAFSALAILGLVGSGGVAPAQAATVGRADIGTNYTTISGVGSTWSANALQQWARNVLSNYHWKVTYSDTGSSAGRQAFAYPNGGADFAVSEIPYALKNSDSVDPVPARKFAYMPIVAGGTSFMYNLVIGGKRVTNLRLSGATVSKIFSGAITKWNDAAVAADNPGLALPAIPIVPVVRSDGSGTSAQLSAWMRSQFPDIWNGLCQRAGKSANCGITSNFPALPGFKAQSGSNGVASYVAQAQYVGSITYVEYSYALNLHFPVAKLLNAAGYYTEPTAGNVAVALLKAQINQDESSVDYLTQILTGVYTNPDPRTYPLSSYSYMLVPTAIEYGFTLDKGLTLAAFANYFLCEGQQQADVLGYSALPINLVQAGLDQVLKIPGGDPKDVNITKCNNPTFSSDGSNKLATTAPQPQPCDKKGSTQCATGTGGAASTPTTTTGGGSTGGGSSTGTGDAPAGSDEGANSAGSGGGEDDSGGAPVDASTDSRPLTVAGAPNMIPVSSTIAAPGLIGAAAAALVVLIAILGPPLMSRVRRRGPPRSRAATPRIHRPSVRRPRSPGAMPTEGP